MENFLPVFYQDVIKCYILGEEFEEAEIDIVACTTTGQLFEFSSRRVINSCDIKCKNALKILHFISYNPLCKYYLIHCASQIVVVSRKKRLEVVKRLNNVIDFEVTDCLHTGKPQVVITVSGSGEPIITDFSEAILYNTNDTQPIVLPEMSLTLSAKLQEMTVQLEKMKTKLKEKQQCRSNTIGQFLPDSPCKTNKDLGVPLQVGVPWQHIHNDQWILGVPLRNLQQRNVENINLLLSMEKETVSRLVYKTYLMVYTKKGTKYMSMDDIAVLPFYQVTHLTGNATAVLAGVIDIPRLTKVNTIRITGSVTYGEQGDSSSDVKQIHLPTVELTAIDLIQGNLRTFSNNEVTVSDVLTVVVASQNYIFDIHLEHVLEIHLTSMLEQHLGFRYLSSMNCYICHRQSAISGTLVILHQQAQQHYTVHLYCRGEEQALLFVHGLYNVLPDHSNICLQKNVEKNIFSASNSLSSELQLFLSVSRMNTKNLPLSQSTVCLTREQWQSIYTKMMKAESATDAAFKEASQTV